MCNTQLAHTNTRILYIIYTYRLLSEGKFKIKASLLENHNNKLLRSPRHKTINDLTAKSIL